MKSQGKTKDELHRLALHGMTKNKASNTKKEVNKILNREYVEKFLSNKWIIELEEFDDEGLGFTIDPKAPKWFKKKYEEFKEDFRIYG